MKDLGDLAGLVVACTPFGSTAGDERRCIIGLMVRAIGRGLVWGQDWSAIWPQSDAEWAGLAVESEACLVNLPAGRKVDAMELVVGESPLDHDKARFKMFDAIVDESDNETDRDVLLGLIDNISSPENVLPHQQKWQITEAVATAYTLGWKAARENFR